MTFPERSAIDLIAATVSVTTLPPASALLAPALAIASVWRELWAFWLIDALISSSDEVVSSTLAACSPVPCDSVAAGADLPDHQPEPLGHLLHGVEQLAHLVLAARLDAVAEVAPRDELDHPHRHGERPGDGAGDEDGDADREEERDGDERHGDAARDPVGVALALRGVIHLPAGVNGHHLRDLPELLEQRIEVLVHRLLGGDGLPGREERRDLLGPRP